MKKFLIAAQEYAQDKGDDELFREMYTNNRAHMDIGDSVWFALADLYGEAIAQKIDAESAPSFI